MLRNTTGEMKYVLPFNPPLLPNFSECVTYDGFMPHEADQIRALWNDDEGMRATLSGSEKYNADLRRSSVMFLEPSEETNWIYERIASLMHNDIILRYRASFSSCN